MQTSFGPAAAFGSSRFVPAAAADSTSGSSESSPTANAGTITANDFLQLLVTEMKNQDPTATTDPNQYINQLVQVNSLQQLIQINQELGGSSTSATAGLRTAPDGAGTPTTDQAEAAQASGKGSVSSGNLAAPAAAAAASRVAESLGAPSVGAPSSAVLQNLSHRHPYAGAVPNPSNAAR